MPNKESGSIIFLLVLLIAVIAGYQFITNIGESLAGQLGMDLVWFWLVVFVVSVVIAGLTLGSDSIKKKLLG